MICPKRLKEQGYLLLGDRVVHHKKNDKRLFILSYIIISLIVRNETNTTLCLMQSAFESRTPAVMNHNIRGFKNTNQTRGRIDNSQPSKTKVLKRFSFLARQRFGGKTMETSKRSKSKTNAVTFRFTKQNKLTITQPVRFAVILVLDHRRPP